MRALANDGKVILISFEHKEHQHVAEKFARLNAPNLELHNFYRHEAVEEERAEPVDFDLAAEGIEFAHSCIERMPDVLILDELTDVIERGLVKLERVTSLLEKVPDQTTVIITGKNAPAVLMHMADTATNFEKLKEKD